MTEEAAQKFTAALRNLAEAVNALHVECRLLRADINDVRGDLYILKAEAAMVARQRVGLSA